MLAQFQSLYPNGSLISELVEIFQGKYIVRASVQIEGVTRATGMAAAETVEAAEDQARNRALVVLGITNAAAESLRFSPKPPISQDQDNSSLNTIPATKNEELLSGQWSITSSKEISVPPINKENIKPDVVTSENLDVPAVSQKSPLTTNTLNANTSDTYRQDLSKQDLGQQFSLSGNREIDFDTPVENLELMSSNQQENPPLFSISGSNVTPFTPRNYSPQEDVVTPTTTTGRKKKKSEPVDLSDVIAKTDVELQRLGWTPEQGREHLIKTYNKRGRTLLTEEELYGFLQYLQSQPDPIAGF